MTCYDCIHYDACSNAGDSGFSCLKEDVSKCKHFKNKADFVEVVRCEDCEWSVKRVRNNEIFSYQCLNTIACGKPRRAYDFCSYGERRDT